MEYRGKHYTIVQGIVPDLWKWTVYLDENKSGEAKSRDAARNSVVWFVDRAPASKKVRPVPPKINS